ncbi:MAG: hypothetical protein WD965_02205 [Actinomycetota bacterium]
MDDRVSKLLLKAVKGLPQREQDQVLAALIRSALPSPVTTAGRPSPVSLPHPRPGSAPIPPEMLLLSDPASAAQGGSVEASGAGVAMLPVRLPPELHERLRRWSNEHGFSMAAVVRGLVERFLDEQGQKKPRRRSPGGRSRPKGSTARGQGPTARG